ncbi:hypothetical protein T12_11073 [Trichinella patagoniensis]|uniref:Uncharacterized protein n=1 Tax=Trichinella patagoniensis TaxID=990121 RepID=A0A0V0ZX26_9BILA|nr:hypothetical protein T12_11073 [Trichinella patagoniensis]
MGTRSRQPAARIRLLVESHCRQQKITPAECSLTGSESVETAQGNNSGKGTMKKGQHSNSSSVDCSRNDALASLRVGQAVSQEPTRHLTVSWIVSVTLHPLGNHNQSQRFNSLSENASCQMWNPHHVGVSPPGCCGASEKMDNYRKGSSWISLVDRHET